MFDESKLAVTIYENLQKCIALRNKYYDVSLQADVATKADQAEALLQVG